MNTPDVTATAVGSMYTSYPVLEASNGVSAAALVGASTLAAVALGFAVSKPSPVKSVLALLVSGVAIALPLAGSAMAARDIALQKPIPASWTGVQV